MCTKPDNTTAQMALRGSDRRRRRCSRRQGWAGRRRQRGRRGDHSRSRERQAVVELSFRHLTDWIAAFGPSWGCSSLS